MKSSISGAALVILGLALGGAVAGSADDTEITAVFATLSNGYSRTKLPDGSLKPETYVVGNGGYARGSAANEPGGDVPFPEIVRVLARHLARSNYFPARDAKAADLLLMISWGTTIPFNDATQRINSTAAFAAMNDLQAANAQSARAALPPTDPRHAATGGQEAANSIQAAARDAADGQMALIDMANDQRSKGDDFNARLLGYAKEISDRDNPSRYAGAGPHFDDLIGDVESERYYVIVAAYDYRVAAADKKRKLLWVTRVSVEAGGGKFKESLTTMMASAARQFGRDSGGLIRRYQTGTVNLGELKVLGTAPDETAPAKPADGK